MEHKSRVRMDAASRRPPKVTVYNRSSERISVMHEGREFIWQPHGRQDVPGEWVDDVVRQSPRNLSDIPPHLANIGIPVLRRDVLKDMSDAEMRGFLLLAAPPGTVVGNPCRQHLANAICDLLGEARVHIQEVAEESPAKEEPGVDFFSPVEKLKMTPPKLADEPVVPPSQIRRK